MKNLMPSLFFKNKKLNIMMHNRMYCFKFWVGIMIVAIFIFGLNSNQSYTQSCTIITSVYDGSVLFGNNEDWHSKDLLIGFYPATKDRFASVQVGFHHRNGSIEFGGAMNDQGLAWDVNSLPRIKLSPHPERTFSHETDNYLSTITGAAATVEEAIKIANNFNFGDSMSLQIHIADATGDAVVISAGRNGEVVFTRKTTGDGYLVSTNFNLANPDNGTKGWRYDTATSMLDKLISSGEISIESIGNILEAVHLNNLTTYTMYSNIFDLKNRKIYLYYLSQYDELVELDLTEEILKGKRIVEMRDLFRADTVEAGQAAYRRFDMRFTAAKIAVILSIILLMTGIIVFGMRKVRTKRQTHTANNEDN